MKLIRILIILLCLTAYLSPGTSRAQARQETDAQRKERVHQLILMRFVKGMNLTREETASLDAILRRRQERKQEHKKAVQAAESQVQSFTESGEKEKLSQALLKLRESQTKLNQVDEEMFNEVKNAFDEIKVGQFVVIMGEIKNEVRSIRREDTAPSPYFHPHYNPNYQAYPPQYLWMP